MSSGKESIKYVIQAKDDASLVFQKVGQAADKAGDDIGGIADRADKGGRLSGMFAKVGPALAAGALAAGAAAAAALAKGVSEAMDRGAINAKLAAQLDLSPAAAARAGKLSGEIFAENYGESMDQVAEAIRRVTQDVAPLSKMTNVQLKSVAEQALNLASVFEQDLGGTTTAVGQLIRNGLVKDATEGINVITAGLTHGVDRAGDLMDTVTEYSTQFRDLGLSGAQAMGLLSQGLKAGARDADTVADALKEFAIRAKDGSASTAAGFKALGLSSSKMAKTFTEGGPKAATALELVFTKLRAIHDPVKRNAAAVALFGTKAEDLQKALYALDPKSAVKGLGDVAHAAKRLDATIGNTPAAKWEKFKRAVTTELAAAGDSVIAFADKAYSKLDASGAIKKAEDAWDGYKSYVSTMVGLYGNALETAYKAGKRFGEKLKPITDHIKEMWEKHVVPAIGRVKKVFADELRPTMEKISSVVREKVMPAVDRLTKAYQRNKPEIERVVHFMTKLVAIAAVVAIKLGGPVARALITLGGFVLGSLIDGLSRTIAVAGALVRGFDRAKSMVVGAVRSMVSQALSHLGTFVHGAAHAFGWIPGIGPKLKSAAADFDRFAARTNAALARIDRDIRIKIRYQILTSGQPPVGAAGGRPPARAAGGPVWPGQDFLVGEHGPEIARFATPATIFAHGTSSPTYAAAAGVDTGGGEYLPVVLKLDTETVYRGMVKLKRQKGGRALGLA